MEKCNTKCNT